MKTEKIYETEAYTSSFEGVVLSCEEKDGSYLVVLDRTAFFPEGGGQSADTGKLGDAEVSDVQIKDGVIYHHLSAPLTVGEKVKGEIHYEKRFLRMQNHGGEHILSGVVHRLFGLNNVGFHMNDTVMTVDFDGPLTPAQVEEAELEANRAVFRNAPVRAFYPTKEELEKLSYRSKIELLEDTRIVEFEGADVCACCAPHVKNTGEIGPIKVISFTPYKKGTRMEVLAGELALRDYLELNGVNRNLMGLYSAVRGEVLEAAEKEHKAYTALKSEHQKALNELAFYRLSLERAGDAYLAVLEGASFDEMRYCANRLIKEGRGMVYLLSDQGEKGVQYVFAAEEGDVRGLVKEVNEAFSGRGGGKAEYAQGTAYPENVENVVTFIKEKQ